jgi:hypothetical protein
MSLGPIPRNFISIVTFQSLLLRGFERLVFRSPTVLEKPLGTFRLHLFNHYFAATHRHGRHPLRHRSNGEREALRSQYHVFRKFVEAASRNAHSSVVYQLSMDAFSDLLDHFAVEGGQIIRLATGDETIVHDDFLIHPATASIAHVRLDRRPRG